MAEVVRQGYVHLLLTVSGKKREWFEKYCILHGPTKNTQAKFLWYENQETYLKEPLVYKAIFLEEIRKIVLPMSPVQKQHLVIVYELSQGRTLLLSMPNVHDYNAWLHAIRDTKIRQRHLAPPAPKPSQRVLELVLGDIYGVEIIETEAALRNKLPEKGLLVVGAFCIQLRSIDHQPICNWKFNHIRRYGRTKNSFTIEAGRISRTGQGRFAFRTAVDGEIIFKSVEHNIGRMDDGDKDSDDEDYIGPNNEDYINAQFHIPAGVGPGALNDHSDMLNPQGPTRPVIDECGYMVMKRKS